MDEDEGGVACEEGVLPMVGIQGAVGLIGKRTLGLARAILGNSRRSKSTGLNDTVQECSLPLDYSARITDKATRMTGEKTLVQYSSYSHDRFSVN